VVRYYDNMWFFYQLQSRMRELRRDVEQPQQQQQNQQQNQQQQKPSGKGGRRERGGTVPRLRAQSNLGSKTTAVVVSFETGKINFPGSIQKPGCGERKSKGPGMNCVNHPGAAVTAFCQNCGKGLCAQCHARSTGQRIFAEPCLAARVTGQVPPGQGIARTVWAASCRRAKSRHGHDSRIHSRRGCHVQRPVHQGHRARAGFSWC